MLGDVIVLQLAFTQLSIAFAVICCEASSFQTLRNFLLVPIAISMHVLHLPNLHPFDNCPYS